MNLSEQSRLSRLKRIKVLCATLAIILTNNCPYSIIKSNQSNTFTNTISDYQLDDLYNYIYNSPYLTKEEKDYLYNPDFLNDVLMSVNSYDYLKEKFYYFFNNIKIESYGKEDYMYEYAKGYYNNSNPEIIRIRDYTSFEDKYKDTIAHEFIHLCQYPFTKDDVFIEATAEIISQEYFQGTIQRTYCDATKLIKEFMEIIGSDAVWSYVFTGDFSEIENRVKPYLTDEEYQRFLNDLPFDTKNKDNNLKRWEDFEQILKILYKNIYHDDIENDEVISLINKHEFTLVRYYFNPRYMGEESSYYFDFSQSTYKKISYEEAINDGLLYVYARKLYPIDYEYAMKQIERGKSIIDREIDTTSAIINITGKKTTFNKQYINGIIDGIKYHEKDVDELVQAGIIKANYYLVYSKRLTYDQYLNQEYINDAEIEFRYSSNIELQEDGVYGLIPKKVILPQLNERFNNQVQYTRVKKDIY